MKIKIRISYMDRFRNSEWGAPQAARIKGPVVLFHGGLGDQKANRPEIESSLLRIARQVQRQISRASAVDLVTAAIYEFEEDPIFNAGYGARLQQDGVARLSCAVMDGSAQRLASVSSLQAQKHPSLIAKSLLPLKDRNLSGSEAATFAFRKKFRPEHLETPERYREWKEKMSGKTGTVGAVALDSRGRTAACTSTGGRGFEMLGRVSDSFTPAGNFASPFGAVSCTGVGEEILEAAVASSIVARLEDGMELSEAIERTYRRHRQSRFGSIALDREGRTCVYATRGALSFGLVTASEICVGVLEEDWIGQARKKKGA